MNRIGQSYGELLDVLTSKYTGGIHKMQYEKTRASINASFDFSSGTLSAAVQGNHVAVCFILGQLVRNVALSKAKVKGIPNKQALEEVLHAVANTAGLSDIPGTRIDLSREYKRGTDHD